MANGITLTDMSHSWSMVGTIFRPNLCDSNIMLFTTKLAPLFFLIFMVIITKTLTFLLL